MAKRNFNVWHNNVKDSLVRSNKSKEMVDKAKVESTSFSIEVREKKMKSVYRVKFGERNSMHVYSH